MWVLYAISCLLFTVNYVWTQAVLNTATTNITQISGNSAVLACQVKNLDTATVVWTGPEETVLTYGRQRITSDERFSVERPYLNDWNLHIRHVKPRDAGEYLCKVNTNPPQTKRVNLMVKVSPTIDNDLSSTSQQTVKEGETVTLKCIVNAEPPANIVWYYINPSKPGIQHQLTSSSEMGETITIEKISRDQSGIYHCQAFNGIPPVSSKNFTINVAFPPTVSTEVERISQYQGRDTVIDCKIKAFPQEIAVWRKGSMEIKEDIPWKLLPTLYKNSDMEYILNLQVFSLEPSDFGLYTCEAFNQYGNSSTSVLITELVITKAPTTTSSTTTVTEAITSTVTSQPDSTTTVSSSFSSTTESTTTTTTTSDENGENEVVIDEIDKDNSSNNNGDPDPSYSIITTPSVKPPDGQDGYTGSAVNIGMMWSHILIIMISIVAII